jgi:hypothetical protein
LALSLKEQMQIETKFDIGNDIYAVELINNQVTCDVCNGEKLFRDSFKTKFSCPKCYGVGNVNQGLKYHIIGPYKIVGIELSIGQDHMEQEKAEEKYNVINNGNYKEAPNYMSFELGKKDIYLFSSKKQAKNKCDSLNKSIKYL